MTASFYTDEQFATNVVGVALSHWGVKYAYSDTEDDCLLFALKMDDGRKVTFKVDVSRVDEVQ